MSEKLAIFVNSVQRELEDERLIVQNLVNTDPFLSTHCVPVLYEFEPASPTGALQSFLESLDQCDVYLLIVGAQYGTTVGEVSITHAEYRRAKERKLPVLAFIGGDRQVMREQMLEHGLDLPVLAADMGYFQVTFPGPGEKMERIRVPENLLLITPAVEARLNDRQRRMMQKLAEGKELTSRECATEFGVTRPVTAADFNKLVEMGLAEKVGAGRSTRYRLKSLQNR